MRENHSLPITKQCGSSCGYHGNLHWITGKRRLFLILQGCSKERHFSCWINSNCRAEQWYSVVSGKEESKNSHCLMDWVKNQLPQLKIWCSCAGEMAFGLSNKNYKKSHFKRKPPTCTSSSERFMNAGFRALCPGNSECKCFKLN